MRLYVCLQKMYVASPYTDPVIAPDSDPQPVDAGDGLIWVVGPVLAVVFIICIVIAILLYKKWAGQINSITPNAKNRNHTDDVHL